jgi:hypothetical protein
MMTSKHLLLFAASLLTFTDAVSLSYPDLTELTGFFLVSMEAWFKPNTFTD